MVSCEIGVSFERRLESVIRFVLQRFPVCEQRE